MRLNARTLGSLGCAVLLSAFGATQAQASSIELNVAATAGPWNWVDGGLNDAYRYGPETQDFTSPAVVDLMADLGLSSGQSYFILFKGGLTSAFGGPPTVDNAGYTYLSAFKDDAPGTSGEPTPSMYMQSEWGTTQIANDPTVDPDPGLSGVFLNALVGTWADSNGAVVGPFSLGTYTTYADGGAARLIGFSGLIPLGATRLQFGLNDDTFSDNTGSLQVCVASTDREVQECVNGVDPTPVPEPATLGLLGAGVLGLVVRRMRSARQ